MGQLAKREFEQITGTKKFTIPEELNNDAVTTLNGIGEFTMAVDWARAALVAAYVIKDVGSGQNRSGKELYHLSIREFSEIGIKGLGSRPSVTHYLMAWGDKQKPLLGEEIELPNEPFPEWGTFKNVHISRNSGENEWYTPPEFIESARIVMGSIDLDPASNELANEIVRAETYYTAETNGLNKVWTGNVWLNPPYAQPEISQFAEKVVLEKENFNQIIVLVNNATDTQWLQSMMQISAAMCFVKTRVKFTDKYGDPGAPLQGQVILYIGDYIKKFYNEFKKYGVCMKMML